MTQQQLYFDYNATTPTDERVVESMLPYFLGKFGNPSSNTHSYGWEADLAVKKARKQIGEFFGADPSKIVFTSGATESNNIVFFSISQALKSKGNHIITSSIEHKCVLNCCSALEMQGYKITYLPVNSNGFIDPKHVEEAITPHTILISIMAANNELGTLQPILEIGKIAENNKILFHTDAAQIAGKLNFKIKDYPVDFVSISAHKMYGPKGIGAIYARPIQLLQSFPFMQGGGQEKGIRSGTLNVPAIIGFAKACEISAPELDKESKRLYELKQILYSVLKSRHQEIRVNGSLENSLPGTLNLCLPGINSTNLLSHLKNKFALSTGSACTSVSQEYSYVLKAIGCTEEEGKSSIRISFGRFITINDINQLSSSIVDYISLVKANQNKII